jgi:hypothetical protein
LTLFKDRVAIWDMRKIKKLKEPIMYIQEPEPIKRIEFCPSKAGRLAVLSEKSSHVNVYRLEERNDYLVSEVVQC